MRLGIVGDFRAEFEPHQATNRVVRHLGEFVWIPTDRVIESELGRYDALWIAPGSPYKSLEGALTAIRYAREHQVPTVGCCAGCQHMVLEFTRNVLGIEDAVHAEYGTPGTEVLTPLVCSIAGKRLEVSLRPGSLIEQAYGSTRAVEQYYCSYGVNPLFQKLLEQAGLRITGTDESGEVRAVELDGHPFFLGTLFVPDAERHPIVSFLEQKVAGKQRVNA